MYHEIIVPPHDNITYQAAPGAPVTVTGFDDVSGWSTSPSLVNGYHIHTAALPSSPAGLIGSSTYSGGVATDEVFQNNQMVTENRYPFTPSDPGSLSTPAFLKVGDSRTPQSTYQTITKTENGHTVSKLAISGYTFWAPTTDIPAAWNGASALVYIIPGQASLSDHIAGGSSFLGEWYAESWPATITSDAGSMKISVTVKPNDTIFTQTISNNDVATAKKRLIAEYFATAGRPILPICC
jgi:hypothetical protein